MARSFKSIISASLVLVPFVIDEMTDIAWKWHTIAAFVVVLFLVDYFVFLKPDTRFDDARESALNFVLQYKFSTLFNNLKVKERLPFRVTVQKPKWTLCGRTMVIVYSFEMMQTDSDYRIKLPRGHGLCWAVFESGDIGWYEKPDDQSADCHGLTDKEKKATDHLMAILSLPLRRQDNEKPHAVLNFDALSKAAVDDLRNERDDLINHQARDLVDLATYVGMFA